MEQNPTPSGGKRYINSYFIIVLAISLFVIAGCFFQQLDIGKGILITLFGSVTAISFYKFFQLVADEHDTLGIERGLPAIDGSVGGWRLTPALTMLIICVLFAIPTLFAAFKPDYRYPGSGHATVNNVKIPAAAVDFKKPDSIKSSPPDSNVSVR